MREIDVCKEWIKMPKVSFKHIGTNDFKEW